MLKRPELELIRKSGLNFTNPYEVVERFEHAIAEYAGAPFAIAVDSATHAIELCLRYLPKPEAVRVPHRTYPSVPMTVLKLGLQLQFEEVPWQGVYQLEPWPILDSSLRFTSLMYVPGTFQCLSFQFRKTLAIGRGGMILTDDQVAYDWLKRAVHDGRTPGTFWHNDDISTLGFHYYMTPEDAARGLLLLQDLPQNIPDLGGYDSYPDLRQFTVFKDLKLGARI